MERLENCLREDVRNNNTLIVYLKHTDINQTKWDHCIKHAINSMPYAYSWYLNLVCRNWDALIFNNYEAVMPLPWKSKLGLKYITNPYYCQQLGVFYTKESLDIDAFIKAIPRKFVYVSQNLNTYNGNSKFAIKRNTNYELILEDINLLRSKYSKNHVKNIKQAKNRGVEISKKVDTFSQFSNKKAIVGQSFMTQTLLHLEQHIMKSLIEQSRGQIYSVSFEGENCSSAFIIHCDRRLILLTSYSDRIGKRKRAYFLLLDHIFSLADYHGYTFDFEGSNLKSIANRNAWFGATPKQYYTIRRFFWQF